MIAKVCSRDGRRRANFRDITAYISKESKALAIRISPALGSADTAAQEMALTASRNLRCMNPVYHYVLSWPAADVVTREQIFDSVERSLRKLGATDDYQWIAAIHGDSIFSHVHIIVNRVHPDTYLQLSIGYAHAKLSEFCREQERRYNWRPGVGLYTLNPVTGEIVRRGRGGVAQDQAINSRAVDGEVWTGHTSFQRWVCDMPALMARQALARSGCNWETIHTALGRFGVTYELYGRGATVAYQSHKRTLRAKASHLGNEFSLPALQQRFGPYQPARRAPDLDPALTYDGQRTAGKLQTEMVKDPAIAALFERYEAEVERWRTRGAVQRRERWREHQHHVSDRIREHNETRDRVRAALKGPSVIQKRYLSAAAHELVEEDRVAMMSARRVERAAITSLYKAPPSLFRLWLKYRAAAEDADARTALGRMRNSTYTRGEHSLPILGETLERKELMAEELSGNLGRDREFDRTAIRKALQSDLERTNGALVDLNRTRAQRRPQDTLPGFGTSSARSAGISDDDVARLAAMYRDYIGKDAIPRELWREQAERERMRATQLVRQFREKLDRFAEADRDAMELRRATRSMLAMDAVFAKIKLQQLFETERTMLAEMLVRARIPSLKEFLAFHAPTDDAARALLQTSEFTQADMSEYFIDPKHAQYMPAPSFSLQNLLHSVNEYGSVTYHLAYSEQEFTDNGTRFDFEKVDRETIRLGLLLGRQKWLDGIEVSGTDAFKIAALREAVSLDITITNPELQQLREQLIKERDAERQSLRERWITQERERETSPITFHSSPQMREEALVRAMQDAALATAQARGFSIGPIREYTDYVEGTILSAWSFTDHGFVVVKRDHSTELVVTSVSRALEAYDRVNEKVHDLQEDLNMQRPSELRRENAPEQSLERTW